MRVVGLLLIALYAGLMSAWSQSSQEYAVMAKRAWAAFECSSLALTAEKRDEAERLFKIGYEQGKRYIEAVSDGKVDRKDIASIVPWGFSASVSGPSTDFALGLVWSSANDNAHRGIRREEMTDKSIDSRLWKSLADTKFARQNCELL